MFEYVKNVLRRLKRDEVAFYLDGRKVGSVKGVWAWLICGFLVGLVAGTLARFIVS